MLSPRTICALLLLSMLWVDSAAAGSSFLSPEHQKAQQKKESKKPPAKLQPRAAEGSLPPEDGSQAEGAEEELEIQFNTPFDVGIKLSGAQFQQHGQALGKFLQDILWEEAEGKSPPGSGSRGFHQVPEGDPHVGNTKPPPQHLTLSFKFFAIGHVCLPETERQRESEKSSPGWGRPRCNLFSILPEILGMHKYRV
ncbi:Appetite-regulating hormone [Tupaia chinensis]|uniref:Appetite-regulating hormone n=1 Tax=Tupaia chinensis TaxID=246437 RepID=L9KL76_TUPCH|nr:Appetite-regulating hormone [Tupaia chinensis]